MAPRRPTRSQARSALAKAAGPTMKKLAQKVSPKKNAVSPKSIAFTGFDRSIKEEMVSRSDHEAKTG